MYVLNWPFKIGWSRGSLHLIIILKSEVSIFPIVVIFFRGCVPEVVVPIVADSFMNIPGNLGFLSFVSVQSYDVRK